MSDRQPPRQVQRKLGDVDADGNWQLGSPAPASATDDKTQTVSVTGHKRRAPTPAAPPFSARDLQARHNAAKEKKKTVKSKPVGQGKQPVPNAEEQPAAAKPNENPATPVQHVPLASIKSESPPDSNGAGTNPIDLTGTVRGTSPCAPPPRPAAAAGATRTAMRRTTSRTAARRRLSTIRTEC